MPDVIGDYFPIILNSRNVVAGSNNSRFEYSFPAGSVNFEHSKIAVASINMFYSNYNVTTSYDNNSFELLYDGNSYDVTFEDGNYSVESLNSYLQDVMVQNNLYTVDANGLNVYYAEIVPNATRYRVQINCYPTVLPSGGTNPAGMVLNGFCPQISIPDTAIVQLLGFSPGNYPPGAAETTIQSAVSDQTPQLSPVQTYVLACDLLYNRYSTPTSILYSFSGGDTAFGSLIQSAPSEYSFIDILSGSYASFSIQILDQNFRNVEFQDDNVCITLLIRNPPL